jgi:hypothetical protein
MRRLLGAIGLIGLTGCGGSDGGDRPASMTGPTPLGTRTVTVLEDDRCYHLGDEVRTDLCRPGVSNLGGPEMRWSFALTSLPTEGRLTLHVVDLGPIGADVRLNGQTINMPLPLGDGSGTGIIPGSVFRLGTNELVIRPRAERADLIEDFQLDLVRLDVTVPA